VDQTPATTQTAPSAQPGETSQPNDAGASNDAHGASGAVTGEFAAVSGPIPDDVAAPLDTSTAEPAPSGPPGFGARGRVRRRARFLRKARELAYRDLGGLVFSLHHFGQRNDELVLAKLATLSRIDAELRALEASLAERQPLTVLREAGITACPRCAAIHSGEDRFCPNCGLPMSRKSDLPIAGAAASGAPAGSPAVVAPAATPASAFAATHGAQTPPTTPPAAPPAAASTAAPVAAPAPGASTTQPAQPGPGGQRAALSEPATQTHAAVSGAGRSPVPPSSPATQSPAQAGDEDQPTEIIRPPASGS
jgi:hypothetical protein